jgi:hypothetical protein
LLESRRLLSGLPLTTNQVSAAYGQLPLSFEANQGQTAPQVNFLARGNGYTLFLTPTGAVLASEPTASAVGGSNNVLRMELVGNNPTAQPAGLEQLPGVSNYFVGNDPKQWHSGIPTYARVEYRQVYPGIDLVYYGNQAQLEYDFVVSPEADPNQIALHFDGAGSIHVDGQGNLVLHATTGDVIEQAPVVYQGAVVGGQVSDAKNPVAGGYVVGSDGTVRFQVGAYDRGRPLVIDPLLVYSTFLGGSKADEGYSIAVDDAGEVYVTGRATSPDFPTANPLQPAPGSAIDAFVAKLNAAGTALIYSTYLGGSGVDVGQGIAIDKHGNAYVAGTTRSSDFPLVNPLQASFNGDDAFVVKINANGTALVFSTYLGGGGGFNGAKAIAVDGAGNSYVTGITSSPSFPTFNALDGTEKGFTDAFVSKINAAGTAFIYSTYLGGSSADDGTAIAVDQFGNGYVTGETNSSDFPTRDAFQPALRGNLDAFLSEINPDGSQFVYSTYLGGKGGTQGTGIAVDSSGEAYVAGATGSTDFPTTAGAWQTTLGGAAGGFVTKFAAGGLSLVFSTFLRKSVGNGPIGNPLAIDAAGNAYVTGTTESNSFLVPTPFPVPSIPGDSGNGYVAKLSADGSMLLDTFYLQGVNGSLVNAVSPNPFVFGYGIAVDKDGNAYVAGATGALDFPTVNPIQPTLKGQESAFISKINTTINNTNYFTGVIQALYVKFLHRTPDQTGLNNDLFFLTHHLGTEANIEAGILGSAEYFATRAGSTSQGFENAVYSDLFGRTIDALGKSKIDLALRDRLFSREQIVRMNINHTYEYDYNLVQTLYEELLGRAASQAEVNNWLVYLRDHTDQDAIEFIVHSPEYLK